MGKMFVMKNILLFPIITILFLSCTNYQIRTIENRITWDNTDEDFVIKINTTKNPKDYVVYHISVKANQFSYIEGKDDTFYRQGYDPRQCFKTTFDKNTFYIYVNKEALNSYLNKEVLDKYPFDDIYYVTVLVYRMGCIFGYYGDRNIEVYIPYKTSFMLQLGL